MIKMSCKPAAAASSTTYWIEGLSTTGSISFGWHLVAGRKRVPRPAAGMTALVTGLVSPMVRGTLPVTVGARSGVEAEFLTAEEPLDVRRVARDHEQRDDSDHRHITPRMSGERDCDRVRDDHHD